MGAFLARLIPKNIAGIVGVVQAVITIIRELLIVATRVCATVIPGDADDKAVAKVRAVFDKVEAVFEKIKGFLLKVGE